MALGADDKTVLCIVMGKVEAVVEGDREGDGDGDGEGEGEEGLIQSATAVTVIGIATSRVVLCG